MFDFSLVAIAPGECGTLVDVGANEGQFLFPALAYFHPRLSLSIEMLDDLAEKLRADPRLDPATNLVIHCAAGDAQGRASCLRSVHSEASSLLRINPEASGWYGIDLRQSQYGEVAVRTLDEICAEHGVRNVDLMKIDVQGHEFPVLKGAAEILARTRNLIIELEFVPVYEGQCLAPAIEAELKRRGFRRKCYLSEYRSGSGRLLHADALFERARTHLT